MSRIGFDAVRALRNSTGLGNYARRVLRGLLTGASGSSITAYLYSSRPARPAYAGLPDELGGVTLRLPGPAWRAPGARALWRTFQIGRRAAADGVELYHGLSHEIPRDLAARGIASVVSFLDLLWVRFPDLYPTIDRKSYEWRYRWSAEHADAIVAASRQTRRELVELYGVEPTRVCVVPPPSDPRYAQPVAPLERLAVLTRYGLPDRFLVSVGTLEARKNQRTALEALAALDPRYAPPLVLIGRDGGTRAELLRTAERLGISQRMHIRSEVSYSDLPAIVQSAELCLYPSLAEGFGLPIVEALGAGIPVIATEGGCFLEAGGPDTLYAPATDARAWADQIQRVLGDPGLARQMGDAGRRYARRFDGSALAAQLVAVYDAVLRMAPLPDDIAESGR